MELGKEEMKLAFGKLDDNAPETWDTTSLSAAFSTNFKKTL